ncbi:MAG TPA: histidine kinase [Micromonosporaceae bacterium]|jgi:signal transduction histidine kinase
MVTPHGVRGWLRARPTLADGLLALVLFGAYLLLIEGTPSERRPDSWWVTVGLALLGVVPVVIRRRWLWPAVWLMALLGAILLPLKGGSLAVFVLAYTAAAALPLRRAIAASAVVWSPALLLLWPSLAKRISPDDPRWVVLLIDGLLALVCFFIGRTMHTRRAYVAALEERAVTAEQNQRALADQAVADERRRIARELHDVVAHHVSVMGVLATGARRILRRDPDTADEALGTIEQTSRTTLREMRRLLDVLRTDAEPAAELTPQPGLAGIEALVEQVREAGLPVVLEVDGEPAGLDPGVALTVYRVIQEALTNALKHAGPATAAVRLWFGAQWLIVDVSDTGRGPRPNGAALGHGLVGMRERVALYGGTLRIGPRSGGGYRVHAKIPADRVGQGVA